MRRCAVGLWLLWLVLISASVQAFPRDSRVPGGIAVIELNQAPKETLKFRNERVTVVQKAGKHLALVGLSLSLKPGIYHLNNGAQRHEFSVTDKAYTTQHIEIKNKRMVNPNPDDVKRIQSERGRKVAAKKYWSERPAEVNFIHPVEGIISGSYGRRRVFNGQPRRPHGGMDIAAPTGTPIVAPAAGTVVELGDFFFSGNMLYLDHGNGLVSLYAHLSQIDVVKGQRVQQGEKIAEVGATGRVTGPHLHWSVGLNNQWIDPALFLPAAESP